MPEKIIPRNWLAISVDLFNTLFISVLFLLSLINSSNIPDWKSHVLQLATALILYPAAAYFLRYMTGELWYTVLHISLVVGLYSFLFQAIAPMQHIIHPDWLDPHIIALETQIFGGELSLLLDRYTFPVLTEWMMFAYVIYVPLVPAVAIFCYLAAGNKAAEEYLLVLVISYAFCFIGFVLFPVATPLFYMPEAYQVELDGWLFTWFGEWIRENQHNPGGGLPSPHTAASTVMLFFMYKYNRKIFYILLPIMVTLYISTAYARYHYITDAVLGIITASVIYGFTKRYIYRISG